MCSALCPRPTPVLYCAASPHLLQGQRGVESQVRVSVVSESAYKTNCSLRASAIRFWAPIASGLAPAEPPTMVQPLHRLGPRLSTLSTYSDRHVVCSTHHTLR